MNETKHTPGPWTSGDQGETWFSIYGADGLPVVASDCAGHGLYRSNVREDAEWAANTRLICAAPDLLAACLGLYPLREDERVRETYGPELDALEAAIEKATTETHRAVAESCGWPSVDKENEDENDQNPM